MLHRIAALTVMLGLVTCAQNDTQISQAVQSRLSAEGVSDQVQVKTERRIVVLEGVVNDPQELNRVELAARSVSGIMGVDNRLVVKNVVNVTNANVGEQPPAPRPAR